MGDVERYIRRSNLERQTRNTGWNELEQAIVLILIEWKVECDMRPSFGEGSDCSDLMNTALAYIKGLISGELTPAQVIETIEENL